MAPGSARGPALLAERPPDRPLERPRRRRSAASCAMRSAWRATMRWRRPSSSAMVFASPATNQGSFSCSWIPAPPIVSGTAVARVRDDGQPGAIASSSGTPKPSCSLSERYRPPSGSARPAPPGRSCPRRACGRRPPSAWPGPEARRRRSGRTCRRSGGGAPRGRRRSRTRRRPGRSRAGTCCQRDDRRPASRARAVRGWRWRKSSKVVRTGITSTVSKPAASSSRRLKFELAMAAPVSRGMACSWSARAGWRRASRSLSKYSSGVMLW